MTPGGQMADVCAFVVGLDHYEAPDWTVAGPCRNALDIARWLLDEAGVPATGIHLFLAVDRQRMASGESADLRRDIDYLRARHVAVEENATQSVIRTFWRGPLKDGTGSKLFVYWSGHGILNEEGRAFVYPGYTTDDPAQALHVESFCRTLRSDAYGRFTEQMILADVCGVFRPELRPHADDVTGVAVDTLQIRAFATPEGGYTRGQGQFTRALLDALGGFPGWPIDRRDRGEGFYKAVNGAFRQQSSEVLHWGVSGAEISSDWCVGCGENTLERSCRDMLSKCHLPDEWLLAPYRRTDSRLNGVLPGADTLAAKLRALGTLERTEAGKAPLGLADFLLRVADLPEITKADAERILRWLENNTTTQTLATARHEIAGESRSRHLIVTLVEDKTDGTLSGCRSELLFGDGSPVLPSEADSADEGPITKVTSVAALECYLRERIAILYKDGHLREGDHIHILAKPVFFHIPFHALDIAPDGAELGTVFIVTLHGRARVPAGSSDPPPMWLGIRKHDEELRRRGTAACVRNWIEVEPGQILSAAAGLRILPFPPPPEGRKARDVLVKLLRLGIPYLCLPDPTRINRPFDLPGALAVDSLDDIPAAFHRARLCGHPLAAHSGLLWDNPHLLPYTPA
ncbi:hypothetical protein [Azospirillum thiophilum]|nr:hypothetical protein [Azospirillum thiophilum]